MTEELLDSFYSLWTSSNGGTQVDQQIRCGEELKDRFYTVAKRGFRRWYRAYLQADVRRTRERRLKISERAYENLF